MKKTLLKPITEITKKSVAVRLENEESSGQLMDLVQELKGALNEAASDLLQPRPEAIERLLGKVLH